MPKKRVARRRKPPTKNTATRASGPPTKRTKKRPKRATKKTAAKAVKLPSLKRKRKKADLKPCLCGCGGMTRSFFMQGHDARFFGWLKKIERGEIKPSEVMNRSMIRTLGPWTEVDNGPEEPKGKRPTHTYHKLAEARDRKLAKEAA